MYDVERLVLLPAATRLTAPGVLRIDLGLGRRVGVRLLLRVVGFLQLPVQVSGLVAQDENMPETAAPVTSSAPCSVVAWLTAARELSAPTYK